ncbi:hypothetical protein QYM36_014574 [Artemia franciscana]|uniref:Uncharacterized protein n=1 Tax=Artemia franciscana TaxID=6661 RepID=A0AA88KVT0_ARTSF|nr:hypothetical protein QYM36_014574 [Artemia franciscana]
MRGMFSVKSVKRKLTRLVMAVEMNRYQADVPCLSETRLNKVYEESIPDRDSENSYLFLNSGAYDGSGNLGVGFMIGLRGQKALLVWDPVNPKKSQTATERKTIQHLYHCCLRTNKSGNIYYADDIVALAADPVIAQAMLNEMAYFSQLVGMKINTVKSKVTDLNIQSDYQLVPYGKEWENVDGFIYIAR